MKDDAIIGWWGDWDADTLIWDDRTFDCCWGKEFNIFIWDFPCTILKYMTAALSISYLVLVNR